MKKISLLAGLFFSALLGAQEIPDDFISFSVPGYEKQMEQIRYDLDHLIDYTIEYFKNLKKKYGGLSLEASYLNIVGDDNA